MTRPQKIIKRSKSTEDLLSKVRLETEEAQKRTQTTKDGIAKIMSEETHDLDQARELIRRVDNRLNEIDRTPPSLVSDSELQTAYNARGDIFGLEKRELLRLKRTLFLKIPNLRSHPEGEVVGREQFGQPGVDPEGARVLREVMDAWTDHGWAETKEDMERREQLQDPKHMRLSPSEREYLERSRKKRLEPEEEEE